MGSSPATSYVLDLWQDYGGAFVPGNDYDKESISISNYALDPKYGYYTVT